MQLTPRIAADPIRWNLDARRGGNHLPTDRAVPVGSFTRSLASGPRYAFAGGIAQSLQGVEVLVEAGGPVNPAVVLARIGAQLAQLPPIVVERLRQIIVYKGQDVGYDQYWERAYKIPNFQAVAAGGGGQVTFFGGKPYTDGVLFHELGHNLPVSSSAWMDAVRSDNATIAALAQTGTLRAVQFEEIPDPARRERWTPRLAPGGVTPYADGRWGEDVSEALNLLLSEVHYGHPFAQVVDAAGGVRALTFAEAYPARTRLLELAAKHDLDGNGRIG